MYVSHLRISQVIKAPAVVLFSLCVFSFPNMNQLDKKFQTALNDQTRDRSDKHTAGIDRTNLNSKLLVPYKNINSKFL